MDDPETLRLFLEDIATSYNDEIIRAKLTIVSESRQWFLINFDISSLLTCNFSLDPVEITAKEYDISVNDAELMKVCFWNTKSEFKYWTKKSLYICKQ